MKSVATPDPSEGDEPGLLAAGGHAPGTYKTPVFLSYPKPCNMEQERFIEAIRAALTARDLQPRTLGVTDYNLRAPLHAIRKLMNESYGLMAIAFRRTYLAAATGNYRTNLATLAEYDLSDKWLTSPWVHVEPAMAYQLGLPVILLREAGVVADGVFEKGVTGLYLPEFDLQDRPEAYLQSVEWRQILRQWEGQVRQVEDRRSMPPQLY